MNVAIIEKESVLEGNYGGVRLDGLSLIVLASFEGNAWAGEAQASLGLFIDERADESQREALQMIFGGQAGGWQGEFAELFGEVRGVEFVPIEFEVADDLAYRGGPQRPDDAAGAAGAISYMASEIEHLRAQLEEAHEANRENRRIIAGLVQRVPELEPARETRESPETTPEGPGDTEAPGAGAAPLVAVSVLRRIMRDHEAGRSEG